MLTSITAGALLGHFYPQTAIRMEFLGKGFVSVVKLFISPIIFLTISLGISGMNDLKKVGRVGGKAILYFEIVTTLALIIGVVVAYIIEPGAGIAASKEHNYDVSTYTQKADTFSWWQFFKENITIQVLLLSILSGIILSKISGAKKITNGLRYVSRYVFKALHLVMLLAPVGAFGRNGFYNW